MSMYTFYNLQKKSVKQAMPNTGSHEETANDQGIFLRDVYTSDNMKMEERKKEDNPHTMTSLLGYIVVCMGIWLVSRFL